MAYEVEINSWAEGIDNKHPAYALSRAALLKAENVDITDSGKLRRRGGLTQVITGAAHSLWADHRVAGGAVVIDDTLYRLDDALGQAAAVTGLPLQVELAYAAVNGDIFWSNGIRTGRLVDNVNRDWGVETPAAPPGITVIPGALDAGTYQITTTYRTASGEESGALNPAAVTLAAVGGVRLTLPIPVSAEVARVAVYMTPLNGDTLYLAALVPVGTATYDVISAPVTSVTLKTQGLDKMPPGRILAHADGRVYVAAGNVVYVSEPFRYGLYDKSRGFYLFASPVTVMLATQAGLYVVADKAYLITAPGTDEARQTELLPYGAAFGTGVYFPDGVRVGWFGHRGQVISEGATVKVLDEKFAPRKVTQGASFVKEALGIKQVITVVRESEDSPINLTGA